MDLSRYTHKTPAAAHVFGVSPNSLKNWASQDPQFPQPVRIGRQVVLWDVDAIRSYFATQRAA